MARKKNSDSRPGGRDSCMPWAEVSIDGLRHNLAAIRSRLSPGVEVMAVVKDNAYGCGSVAVAGALEADGVRHFAVARAVEAQALRRAGIAATLLVLGEASEIELRWGSRNNVHFALNDMATMKRWAATGIPIRFHCKVDTGMGRMGLLPGEAGSMARFVKLHRRLTCRGVFTHLACADAPGGSSAETQLAVFAKVLKEIRSFGIEPPYVHCANSAGVVRLQDTFCTMARPGIALYGGKPDPAREFQMELRQVLSLKARVVKIKKVEAGTPLSYGWNYRTPAAGFVATIALGYGQGLPRALSGTGEVLIRGMRHRIAGNVTMDGILVDLGPATNVRVGDEVVAIGSQGSEAITCDDVALRCGTIGYEILCGISASIDRVYIKGGRVWRRLPASVF